MNRRLLLILICALVGGISASYLAYRLARGSSGPAPVPMAQVVLATRDLPIGTLIGPSDVRMGPWAGTLPNGALPKLDAAVGRGAIAKLYENEPVIADRLAATGSGGGLAAIIPSGMRASAVRVNDVVGLAGFVTPGMRVDVLMSGIAPGGSQGDGPRVKTLLQNIQVLSAGENLQRDSEGKPHPVQVVNLLVTPEQAEKLTLASYQTQIQLILRNPMDMESTQPPGARMTELFGSSAARPVEALVREPAGPRSVRIPTPAPPPPHAPEVVPPKVRVIEVFNGTTKTVVTLTVRENSR